jgi:NADPH2:quinone reductase
LTSHHGVDVVFDPVGDRFTELTMRSMGWGGRYLIVGFAAGQIPKLALNLPLLKGVAILGVWWGGLMKTDSAMAHRLMQELIDQLAAGHISPSVSAEYPLTRASDALNEIATRRATGKIILDLEACARQMRKDLTHHE